MKKYLILALLAAGTLFTACSDDDDNYVKNLPTAVEAAFGQKYPASASPRWTNESGRYKAEFRNADGTETEVWFRPDGTWVRSETEVYPSALPEAVKAFVAANYGGYYVDDAEYIETLTASYYHLELEGKGKPDAEVNVYADGTPFEGLADGKVPAGALPQAVADLFAEKYPGTEVREWEVEGGLYKAEFRTADGMEAEAFFSPEGVWVGTEYEFRGSLPVAVQSYLASNYADYRVDDVNYVQTPLGDYYEIELERKGKPDVLVRLMADGTPWQ